MALERIAGDAVACSLNTGDVRRAVELWEMGRGMQRGLATEEDLERLRASHGTSYRRLSSIVAELSGQVPTASEHPRFGLAEDYDRVVHQIRAMPGFESFLGPPSAGALLQVGREDPVVLVNVSDIRSDAIILQRSDIQVVGLSGLTPETLEQQAAWYFSAQFAQVRRPSGVGQPMFRLLSWLWDTVAEPVLAHLDGQPSKDREGQYRLRWCLGRELALMPLHAAGHYDGGDPNLSLLDRAVSSYLPSLRSLLRSPGTSAKARVNKQVVAVIDSSLPGAVAESQTLVELLPASELRVLSGAHLRRETVLAALLSAEWFHFAGHYAYDPADPMSSGCVLADSTLTLRELLQVRLNRPELAFLSASETSRGWEYSPSEGASLASGLLLAGFNSVVGCLWQLEDVTAARMTKLFYEGLIAGDTPAHALNTATRALRNHLPSRPDIWAAYTHTGDR